MDMDARDRFGLRLNFMLLEDTERMEARYADTERFVVEAAEGRDPSSWKEGGPTAFPSRAQAT
jgi:hypothetical protein